VATVALFVAIFQTYVFLKRREFWWVLWGAVLAGGTFIYATAIFFQYNLPAGPGNRLTELFQYSTFVILVHGIYGFTYSYFSLPQRRYHLIFGPIHGIILLLIWTTDFVIGREFVERSLLLLDGPYIEPRITALGGLYLFYAVLASANAVRLWLVYRKHTDMPTGAFIAGFSVWILLGANDVAATLGAPAVLFLMEYGFLAFSLSVLVVSIQSYIDLMTILGVREENLFAEKERLDIILRSLGEGFLATDRKGNIVLFNAIAEKLTQVPRSLAIGKPYSQVLHIIAEHGAQNGESSGPLGKGRTVTLLGKDGAERIVQLTRTPVTDRKGEHEGEVFLFRDVSGWVSDRKQLATSEEKYRSILESIQEGYYEVDLGGRLTFLNSAAAKMCGYTVEEMLGLNNRDYTTPQTSEKLYRIYNRIYRTGEPENIAVYEIIRKDGEVRTLEASASIITDSYGRPVGFRGMLRDVTDKLAADKRREQLEEQLRQAQKREALGTLAGGVAHDFNNLLMAIQGSIEMLLLQLETNSPFGERLISVKHFVEDAAKLTRQLLGFARGGKYEVRPAFVRDMARRTATMFGRTRKEVAVHMDLSETWPVEVDKGQFEQVLVNLYVNAWQAMNNGGEIIVSSRDLLVTDEFAAANGIFPGRFVQVCVQDTGCGMDENTLARVFDPFFTTKAKARGTGLGLASAYGIVKNHGGVITVESTPGEGSRFCIYLPATDRPVDQQEVADDDIVHGRGTVLVVDDEISVLETESEMIRSLGYKVFSASGGRAAIDIYKEKKDDISLVVLDMIMPEMAGIEVFESIKKINPQARVLLCSGYSLDGQAGRIMEKGCDGFLQKPFGMSAISRKIHEILTKDNSNQQK
jgi:PAS domain S-box-containing protein